MKLIHTSDLHLESPLSARLTPSRITERKRELFSNLRRLCVEARRLGVCGIIIAGDLFDSEHIGIGAKKRMFAVLSEFSDVSFFYLPGNHERSALIASEDLPKNLFVFGEKWTKFCIGDVCLQGRSETDEAMFSEFSPDPCRKNIVVLHGELRDRSASDGVIGEKELPGKGIDYLALGHYHSFGERQIPGGGVAVYSGTPEGRGFDEAGEKGFVLLDTAGDGIAYRFFPFANRKLHILPVDISGCLSLYEMEERVASAVKTIRREDLVRVVLTGSYRIDSGKDALAITERFRDDFYFFETRDESTLSYSIEDFRNDKSLKGELIRLVMAKEDLSDTEKNEIIRCALATLAGVEFE